MAKPILSYRPDTKPPPDNVQDLTGRSNGRLTVSGYLRSRKPGAVWLTQCDCGNYEPRSTKAILSRRNVHDACHVCRCKREGR